MPEIITFKEEGNIITYCLNGTKKYKSYRNPDNEKDRWFTEYDKNGNEIYFENSDGLKWWADYTDSGDGKRTVHARTSEGYEFWNEYGKKGELISARIKR
jgi:hypothetical protein